MRVHTIDPSPSPSPSPSPPRRPATPPVAAVLWDYDGTLVDTRRDDEDAVARLVREDPAVAAGVELFWASEGRPLVERLELAWPGRAAELLAFFDAPAAPRVFPGVRRALRLLGEAGVAQAVVSSRRLEPLRRGLEAARLAGMVGCVVGLESVSICKPDPEGLLLAMAMLEVSAPVTVFVGDRDVDMEAARGAGVPGWHAVWSGHPERLAGAERLLSPEEVTRRVLLPVAETG